jgi:putative membrane protein insertion efficiency factor
MRFVWEALIRAPSWLLIGVVRLYQITLSPVIGRQCRFTPTCSNYMIRAILKYGALLGTCRGVWRIVRCNPWCRGGNDPP